MYLIVYLYLFEFVSAYYTVIEQAYGLNLCLASKISETVQYRGVWFMLLIGVQDIFCCCFCSQHITLGLGISYQS